ncbi:hypothetical protein [Bradyrhizobium zhanjiangense]|uniref:hypothetical protein n=1 Tax=Bradyrhizobium zhanjiangense TaxID=1325107 RepID=UPI001009B0DC|nr:hypothetical protein [Bradyrhizobium zhanjiangense]
MSAEVDGYTTWVCLLRMGHKIYTIELELHLARDIPAKVHLPLAIWPGKAKLARTAEEWC